MVYLEETWANAHDTRENMWVEDVPRVSVGTKGGIRKPSGKGKRLLILHAGSESGWINGVYLAFRVKGHWRLP